MPHIHGSFLEGRGTAGNLRRVRFPAAKVKKVSAVSAPIETAMFSGKSVRTLGADTLRTVRSVRTRLRSTRIAA